MDFKTATDLLFGRVSHGDLARGLGVSVALIRQARLRDKAHSYREPPPGWREVVIRIAEQRIMQYRALIEALRNERTSN